LTKYSPLDLVTKRCAKKIAIESLIKGAIIVVSTHAKEDASL